MDGEREPNSIMLALPTLDSLQDEIDADFDYCREQVNQNPESQFWRRATFRCVFSCIEAKIFILKQQALHQHRWFNFENLEKITKALGEGVDIKVLAPKLSAVEVCLLEEVSPYTDNQGRVKPKDAFPNFIPNMRFAFKIHQRALNYTNNINYGCQKYQSFQNALAVSDGAHRN